MADPIGVRVDESGRRLCAGLGRPVCAQVLSGGDQVAVYGGQAGRGPGEFSNLTDADVEPDGTVWTCDPVNGLVTVFNSDGNVRSTMRTDRPPHRLALLGEGNFIMMPSPAGQFLFHRYDGHGTLADTCGTVVRDQERMSVILDGRCAGSPDGRFVYAGYRAGILALFDLHRHPPLFFAQTLEHPGLPQVFAQQTGDFQLVRVHPDAPMVSRSVSLVGNMVHVLSGSLSPDRNGVIDVYEHDTGRYLHSYELPAIVSSAYRTEEMLYVVADTTVSVWKVNSVEHMTGGVAMNIRRSISACPDPARWCMLWVGRSRAGKAAETLFLMHGGRRMRSRSRLLHDDQMSGWYLVFVSGRGEDPVADTLPGPPGSCSLRVFTRRTL